MISWLIQGQNTRNGDADARRRCTPGGVGEPAFKRGRTACRTLDQKTAMRLKQRHTCSTRRRGGRKERAANGGWLDKGSVEGLRVAAGGLCPGRRKAFRALNLSRAGRRRRGCTAPRHAARAWMAAGAALGLGPESIDRLHLRQGGADDGEDKPDNTFHYRAKDIPWSAPGNYYSFCGRHGPPPHIFRKTFIQT
jgi:hypothetical protein